MADGSIQSYVGGTALNTTATINDTQWHHVALVYDGATLQFYVDGVPDNSASRIAEASDGPLWLGRHKFIANAYLDGALDDGVVLSQALDADGIVDLMNGRFNPNDNLLAPNTDLSYQATVTNTSSNTATGFLVAENTYFDPALRHPVAAYSFELEERLAYFVNETGGESAIVCVDDGTCPTQISGPNNTGYNTALWFNGTSHTMRLPAMSAHTDGDQFNLSFWVNLNSYPAPGERVMLVDTDSDEPGAIDMYINSDGNVVVDVAGHPDGPSVDSRVLNLNNNHISLDGHFELFINGTPEFLNSWTTNPPNAFQVGPGTLGNSLDGSEPFYGQIDEVVFYTTARDTTQVNNIKNGNYGGSSQLFRFEQLIRYDGTTFYSQSNTNHATCSGDTCPTLTEADGGYNGRAAIFDGVDDFATQPGNFTADTPTLTFFVNPADYPSAGNRAYIYDTQADGSGTTLTFDLYLDENGQLTLDYGSGRTTTYNTVIPQNQWSKVEVVFALFSESGITHYRIYLDVDDVRDGAYAGICAGTFTTCSSYQARVGNGRIGNDLAGDAPFEGMLDQLNLRISGMVHFPG
jgi:hypothetical protein